MNYTKALHNPIFKIISQAAQELGIESYVIGGFVRDYLLERDFKKDNFTFYSIHPKFISFKINDHIFNLIIFNSFCCL